MNKKELIEQVKKNFSIKELVCPQVFNKWGSETSWQFLQKDLLEVIHILRNELLMTPMIVNTWGVGGKYDERGLRCNLSETVKSKTDSGTLYLSPHLMGCAIDFHTKEISAEEIRNIIRRNWVTVSDIPIRLERGTNWVHIDIFNKGVNELITEFNG